MLNLFIHLLLLTLVKSTTYTLSIDNSSLIMPENFVNESMLGGYISFKQDCYPGSQNQKPNNIVIRTFPSWNLRKQSGTKKMMISHINQLFSDSNKIFTNQLNIKLVPQIVLPKQNHPQPINKGINALGDLNAFGNLLIGKSHAPLNIFITNNYNGIVGAAYVNVLGSRRFNYGVSVNTASTLSHEILHMMGAHHVKSGVMSYNDRLINGLLQMHPDNKDSVCGCLNNYFKK